MTDRYDGPAALVADDGTDMPVTARLWRTAEPGPEMVGPGGFMETLGVVWQWRGILEGPFVGRRLCVPGTLRLPDGRTGRITGMEGDSAAPDRVEIEGAGTAPWLQEAKAS